VKKVSQTLIAIVIVAAIFSLALVNGTRNNAIIRLFHAAEDMELETTPQDISTAERLEEYEKNKADLYAYSENPEIVIKIGDAAITREAYEIERILQYNYADPEKKAVWALLEREIMYGEAKERGLDDTADETEESVARAIGRLEAGLREIYRAEVNPKQTYEAFRDEFVEAAIRSAKIEIVARDIWEIVKR
jgi:hypothetical protein